MRRQEDNIVRANNLALDTLIDAFYHGDTIVAGHDDHLRNAIKLILMTLTARPVRTLLIAGRRVRSNDGPKVYGLSQFTGACESVMAGTALLRVGYPHEVPTLCRRAFECGALALYYIDKPSAWQGQIDPLVKEGTKIFRSPPVGKAVDHFVQRGSKVADSRGFKDLYGHLSQHAHSGPGVRALANYVEPERLRLGPISAHGDHEAEFRKSYEGLKLTAEILHAMISFAYEREIDEAAEEGDVPEIGQGEFGAV